MDNTIDEKDKFANVVVDLQARSKELESKMEESELGALEEMVNNKELEEELLVFKKEIMEQHE